MFVTRVLPCSKRDYKKDGKYPNNKRLIVCSLLAGVIAFTGVGITAPEEMETSSAEKAIETTTISTQSSSEVQASKEKEEKKKEEEEKQKKLAKEKKKKEEEKQRIEARQREEEQFQQAQQQDDVGEMVYVTPTGEKYHTHPHGNGDFSQTTLENAQSMGLEPCKVCY
ncbi:hypothetical protein [Tetragenococcus solitarius]|uniref:Uncharacterized protein n=1 Tax=Tetragenococcus solitarius TaxID=71453 RepID=A0ABN3Y1Z0_9ENTE|nr:hypothetical protein [Tetragenococcus solitarius]